MLQLGSKKFIFFISLFLIFTVFFVVWYFFFKDNNKVATNISSGIVEEIDENFIVISKDNPDLSSSEQKINTKISIDSNVRFYKKGSEIKSEEEFLSEQNEDNSIAPSWHKENEISKADLKNGDNVNLYYKKGKVFKVVVFEEFAKSEQYLSLEADRKLLFSGFIIDFDPSSMELKVAPKGDDSTNNQEPQTFVIKEETEIIKKTKKSEEDFLIEQREFQQKINSGGDIKTLEAPQWFILNEIDFSQLKNNDQVNVEYGYSENNDGEKEAKKIFVF